MTARRAFKPDEKHPRNLTAAVRVLVVQLAGAGISQNDVARRAGMDKAVLSRWFSAGREQRDEHGLAPRRFDEDRRRWEPSSKSTSALVELLQAWEHAQVGAAMDAVHTLRMAAAGRLEPIRTVTTQKLDSDGNRTIEKVESQPASIDAAKWIAERLLPDSFRQKPEEATTSTQQPTTIVYVQQPVEPDAVPTVMGAPLVDPTTTSTT
jgi:hypothetical protein